MLAGRGPPFLTPALPTRCSPPSVPHCCGYVGAFQDSKQIYIVMEHAEGGDLLEQLLREGRAMTEKRVVREVRFGGVRILVRGLMIEKPRRFGGGCCASCKL